MIFHVHIECELEADDIDDALAKLGARFTGVAEEGLDWFDSHDDPMCGGEIQIRPAARA